MNNHFCDQWFGLTAEFVLKPLCPGDLKGNNFQALCLVFLIYRTAGLHKPVLLDLFQQSPNVKGPKEECLS